MIILAAALAAATGLSGERVVVLGAEGAERTVPVIEAALVARGLVLLPPEERLGLDGAAPSLGDREAVRARLLAARVAYRDLELDQAAAAAEVALEEALRLARPEEHVDLLVDVLLFQATLRLARGDQTGAAADLRLATRLEPSRTALDEALHPPSVREAWINARDANDRAQAAEPVAYVVRPRVRTGDATLTAEVIVDGVVADVGDGVLQIAAGPHLLSARAPGCRAVHRVIGESDERAFADVLIKESELEARVALAAKVRAGDEAALAPLGRAAGVTVAVLARDAALIGVVGDGDIARVPLLSGEPVTSVDALLALLAPPEVDPPPPVRVPPREEPAWPVGAIVAGASGVVLVGAAIAVVAWQLLPGTTPPPPPRPVPIICCGP